MAKRLPQRPLRPRRPRRAAPMTAPSRLAAALWMGLALGATTVGLAQAQPAGQAAADARRVFNIPAGPLDRALGSFASAAGVELSVDASLLRGRSSAGLAGSFTVREGFAELLRGHGLQAVRQANGSFTLDVAPPPPAPTGAGEVQAGHGMLPEVRAVSYTHLTLPTILLV